MKIIERKDPDAEDDWLSGWWSIGLTPAPIKKSLEFAIFFPSEQVKTTDYFVIRLGEKYYIFESEAEFMRFFEKLEESVDPVLAVNKIIALEDRINDLGAEE